MVVVVVVVVVVVMGNQQDKLLSGSWISTSNSLHSIWPLARSTPLRTRSTKPWRGSLTLLRENRGGTRGQKSDARRERRETKGESSRTGSAAGT